MTPKAIAVLLTLLTSLLLGSPGWAQQTGKIPRVGVLWGGTPVFAKRPAVYELREYVNAGGLASYGPGLEAMIRRVAVFADKILRGAKPADLPVEQPSQLELVLNGKAATAMGLSFSPSVAVRADHILQ